MELSRLAAHQRRLKSWAEFTHTEVRDEQLTQEILNLLELYQATLARCWKHEQVTSDDQIEIADLERKLEALNETARLTSASSVPR